jgi:hypothetical protein
VKVARHFESTHVRVRYDNVWACSLPEEHGAQFTRIIRLLRDKEDRGAPLHQCKLFAGEVL